MMNGPIVLLALLQTNKKHIVCCQLYIIVYKYIENSTHINITFLAQPNSQIIVTIIIFRLCECT